VAQPPGAQPVEAQPPVPSQAAPTSRHRTRDRRLGLTGEVLGIIGMVVCIVLIIGVILARNWLTSTVDETAAAVDGGLGSAITLLDTASSRVGEVEARVGEVTDAANALATDENPVPELSSALAAKLAPLSDRYLNLRTAYAGIREKIVSALDRLQLLDRLVPALSIPQGPVDALGALDAKAQEFDQAVMGLLEVTPGAGAANAFGAAVAQATTKVTTALDGVTAGLSDMTGKVQGLQANVKAKAGEVDNIITFGAMVMIALLAYLTFLNFVFFTSSRHLRAGH